jgi:hypothetical protein
MQVRYVYFLASARTALQAQSKQSSYMPRKRVIPILTQLWAAQEKNESFNHRDKTIIANRCSTMAAQETDRSISYPTTV